MTDNSLCNLREVDQNLVFLKAFEEKSKALKAKDALIAELQGNLKRKEMENDVSENTTSDFSTRNACS